jgi:hypothetical protein
MNMAATGLISKKVEKLKAGISTLRRQCSASRTTTVLRN